MAHKIFAKGLAGTETMKELGSAIGSGAWKELHVITKLGLSEPKSEYQVLVHEREIFRGRSMQQALKAYNESDGLKIVK
jgi:hypothetical protein